MCSVTYWKHQLNYKFLSMQHVIQILMSLKSEICFYSGFSLWSSWTTSTCSWILRFLQPIRYLLQIRNKICLNLTFEAIPKRILFCLGINKFWCICIQIGWFGPWRPDNFDLSKLHALWPESTGKCHYWHDSWDPLNSHFLNVTVQR